MEIVGRNDFCPCGSGKKYKKCCGKNNVISMDLLIEKELNEIQVDLFHFSMANYQEVMTDYFAEWYLENPIPEEAMELYHFFACTWFITSVEIEGKTIMAEYVDRKLKKVTRQRMKDILPTWKNARPSVFEILQQEENQLITVRDIFSGEIQKAKALEEEHIVEQGGLIIGTLLPVGETSLFFTTFLDTPKSESEERKQDLLTFYENSDVENPVEFMSEFFLEVLELFIFGHSSFSIEDMEWASPKHEEVAREFQQYMESNEYEDVLINVGVYLWNLYCERRNPKIIKPSVYTAALVYLIDKLDPFGVELTQKEAAEEFHVSVSGLSSKYKDMEDTLSEELDDLDRYLESISYFDDDYDDEDIFDEDELWDEDDILVDLDDLFDNDDSNDK